MRYASVDVGKRVSHIGLGTWQFGSAEWGYGPEYDDREAAAIVRRALELGVTLFDTAEIYGRGRSEQILGAALRDADADLDSIVVASKIFPVLPVDSIVQHRAMASARRLGVRCIDLYQVHQPNPVIKDGTTMRGMQALLQVGLVGHVGVSNYSLARWKAADQALAKASRPARTRGDASQSQTSAASAVSPSPAPVVLSNQVQYSLVHRAPEAELVPFARDNQRLVIAYSPLAQGLLSGRFTSADRISGVRAVNHHFLPENLAAATPLIDTLRDVANTRQMTPPQVALAWVIRHPFVAAIPGASSVAQLESNVAAAELELTPDEVAALDDAAHRYRPISGLKAAPKVIRTIWHNRRNRV